MRICAIIGFALAFLIAFFAASPVAQSITPTPTRALVPVTKAAIPTRKPTATPTYAPPPPIDCNAMWWPGCEWRIYLPIIQCGAVGKDTDSKAEIICK